MGWNQEVYTEVTNELHARREKALGEAIVRKQYAEDTVPEIALINKALDETGFMMLGAGINGKDGFDKKVEEIRAKTEYLRQRKRELLISAGLDPDYDDPKFVCDLCGDSGNIKGVICKCKRELLAVRSLESCGLSEVMKEQSFDNFSLDKYPEDIREEIGSHVSSLRNWAENFTGKGNYILTGGTGLGKTHLSSSVAKTVVHRGYDVIYITADEFFGAFQKQRFGGGCVGDGTTECFSKCDLLIIDDLGTEVTNKFIVSCLYNVVNNRMNAAKATMISTNLTGQELQNRYEERTGSRIFGNYAPLIFTGKDIRRQRLADAH